MNMASSEGVTLLSNDMEMAWLGPAAVTTREEDVVSTLFDVVRFGLRTQLAKMLERASNAAELCNSYNDAGHTLVHISTKKGDVETLEVLLSHGADINKPTSDEGKMQPIHWAASECELRILRYLLTKGADINAVNGLGCTPLIIAAQHGKATNVVYLLRNHADYSICDDNGDNAIHWAAYKNQVEVVCLLAHEMQECLDFPDKFGATPLHLAAMRGNYATVELLVRDLKACTTLEDRSGCIPVDLAKQRGKLGVELLLREIAAKDNFDYFTNVVWKNFSAKACNLLFVGKTDREVFRWPFRAVVVSLSVGVFWTWRLINDPRMGDLRGLQIMCVIAQFFAWTMLLTTRFKDAGIITPDSQPVDAYERALDAIGVADREDNAPSLCHTCRIIRPLRSKHCKVMGKCVYAFDHYCPFVGNVVGRDNYKFFFGFCIVMLVAIPLVEIHCIYYIRRARADWQTILFMLYMLGWLLLDFGLVWYHTQLVVMNLTTNEHINMMKYSYMRDSFGLISNPFGVSLVTNVCDRLCPSQAVYFSREEVESSYGLPAARIRHSYQILSQTKSYTHTNSNSTPSNISGPSSGPGSSVVRGLMHV